MPRLLPRTEPTAGLLALTGGQAREINRFLVAGLLTAAEANAARAGELPLDWADLRRRRAASCVHAPPSTVAPTPDRALASLLADPPLHQETAPAAAPAASVSSAMDTGPQMLHQMPRLTARQMRVLDLMAQGATVEQMMRVLTCTRASVYTYRQEAKKLIGATSAHEAPARWVRLCRVAGRRMRYMVFADTDASVSRLGVGGDDGGQRNATKHPAFQVDGAA